MISAIKAYAIAKDFGFTQNKQCGPASLFYKPLDHDNYLGVLLYAVGKKESKVVHFGFGNTAVEEFKSKVFNIPKNLIQELTYYINLSPYMINQQAFIGFLSNTNFNVVANECLTALKKSETPKYFDLMSEAAKELVVFDALILAILENGVLSSEEILRTVESETNFSSKQLSFMFQKLKSYLASE